MPELDVHLFTCRSDNYGVLLHDRDTNKTLSIDAPEANAVRSALRDRGWSLDYILTTHHHTDHVEGNEPLKAETGCQIIGPSGEAERIPGIDTALDEGEVFEFGSRQVQVISTPGHTIAPSTYWLAQDNLLFAGDTLFSMGCGRLFEGTAEMMWNSLEKLMALPPDTQIYCGHEYTLSNGEFALSVEPGNAELVKRVEEVRALRRERKPTLPAGLGLELATNPFLRPMSPEIRRNLDMQDAENWEVFGAIRRLKDQS